MALVLFVRELSQLVVAAMVVTVDKMSAAPKKLADRDERDAREALEHALLETVEGVVAVGAGVALGRAPVGPAQVELAVVLGEEEADVAAGRDRLL